MFNLKSNINSNLVLKGALASGNFSHTWLFYGDEIEHLNELAKNFVMAMFCSGNNRPCCECESCISFLAGTCVDFHQLNAIGNLNSNSFSIEQARNFIVKMHSKPLNSSFLVFLVCGVDEMLQSSANVFLKILEEPPKNVILILTAKNKFKVLPTILSRCTQVRISQMHRKKCAKILNEQFPDCDEEFIKKAVHFGEGLLGKSSKFLKNSLWKQGLEIANDLFSAYLQKNELLFLSLTVKLDGDVELTNVVLECFCVLLHDFLVSKAVGKISSFNEVKRVFNCLEKAKLCIVNNCNLKFVLTTLSCAVFC